MFASFKDLMRLLEQSIEGLSTHGLQVAVDRYDMFIQHSCVYVQTEKLSD